MKIHFIIILPIAIISLFIHALLFWVDHEFKGPNVEQILYHLIFFSEGKIIDNGIYNRFYIECLIFPLILIFPLTYEINRKLEKYGQKKVYIFFTIFLSFSFLFFFYKIDFLNKILLPKLDTNYYDFYEDNYYEPPLNVTSSSNKNIVTIYLESIDTSFNNPEIYDFQPLSKFDQVNGKIIKNFLQSPNTHWTIAGIIASQCGVPTNIRFYSKNWFGENLTSYFENLTCLSDILNKLNYEQIFINGLDIKFGGTKTFLTTHKFDKYYGKYEIINKNITKDEPLSWGGGFNDNTVFAASKSIVKELVERDQKFNLNILTLDTHIPNGFLSNKCKLNDDQKLIINALDCTVDEVLNFIQFLKDLGIYENTIVVIVGDHRWNTNEFKIDINQYESIFNLIIDHKKNSFNRTKATHFDLMPTIYNLLDIYPKTNRMGLGVDLYNENPNHDKFLENIFKFSDKFSRIYDSFF